MTMRDVSVRVSVTISMGVSMSVLMSRPCSVVAANMQCLVKILEIAA